MNDKVLNTILDYLDGTQSIEATKRREFTRIQYRRSSVVLAVRTPAGIDTVAKVACRNLSSGGISVLHSAFLHAGSVCVVVLEHPLHGNTPIRGRVARCQHRSGLMHEIGIRFDEQINTRDFVETDSQVLTLESIDPDKLKGTVVHFSPDPQFRQTLRNALREFPLFIKSVATVEDLIQQIQRGADAIFIQPSELTSVNELIRDLQSRTTHSICVLVPAAEYPMQFATGDFRVLSLAWPVDTKHLHATLAEMLLVLAPGATRDSLSTNDDTLARISAVAAKLAPLADSNSSGALAKALSEISRLATLISRHDLVDLAARARSKLLDLAKPEPHRLKQFIKPVQDAIQSPASKAGESAAA